MKSDTVANSKSFWIVRRLEKSPVFLYPLLPFDLPFFDKQANIKTVVDDD